MPDFRQIVPIEERRRLLLAESARLRRQLATDFAGLKTTAQRAERVVSVALSLRALWPVIAGLAGLWLGRRRQGGLLQKVGKLWSWWNVGKKVMSFWEARKPRAPGPGL